MDTLQEAQEAQADFMHHKRVHRFSTRRWAGIGLLPLTSSELPESERRYGLAVLVEPDHAEDERSHVNKVYKKLGADSLVSVIDVVPVGRAYAQSAELLTVTRPDVNPALTEQ